MTQAVLAEERYREGLAILIDHSETRWSRLTAQDARRRVALLERQAEEIGHQRIAFVVSSAADFGIGGCSPSSSRAAPTSTAGSSSPRTTPAPGSASASYACASLYTVPSSAAT